MAVALITFGTRAPNLSLKPVDEARVSEVDALAAASAGVDVAIEPAEDKEVAELGREQVARREVAGPAADEGRSVRT